MSERLLCTLYIVHVPFVFSHFAFPFRCFERCVRLSMHETCRYHFEHEICARVRSRRSGRADSLRSKAANTGRRSTGISCSIWPPYLNTKSAGRKRTESKKRLTKSVRPKGKRKEETVDRRHVHAKHVSLAQVHRLGPSNSIELLA